MKLFIAGHQGMVGAALMRRLAHESGIMLLTRSRQELKAQQAALASDRAARAAAKKEQAEKELKAEEEARAERQVAIIIFHDKAMSS